HTAYAPNVPDKNYAQFIVNTVSEKATINMLDEYAPTYSNYFPNAYVRFKQLDYQNTVAPIEVRFSGDNLGALKNSADSLMLQLRSMPELTWLHTNFKEMTPGVKVDIDPVESNRLGINRSFVSANLMMHQSGMPMTTIWENDYPVSVMLRSEQTNDSSFDNVKDEYINTFLPGVAVPLRQIAKVEPDWTQGQIVRRNGVRTISVLADVVRGKNTNKVFNKVEKVTEKLSLPKGVTVQYGGAHEFDSDVLPKVMNGLVASILIIFLILLFHFQNVSMALVVLLSSSLTLVGAVIGLLVLHLEFSVTSILGVVSLIGILVRNGIIMLDYAEMLRRKQKKTVYEAALEAGKRRMRPIFLTSMAASMGVIPMVISRSTLWSPMGAVILFGTMISMVLIVLILPVAYWLIYRGKDKKTHKKGLLQPATVTLLVCLMASVSPAFSQSSYTLDQCKALALQNNVSVKNRTLEVRSSEQVKKEAFTNYFPKINAGAATFRFNDPLIDKTIPGGNLPVYNGNPATLATATQFAYFPGFSFTGLEKGTIGLVTAVEPLFTGGRIYNGNRLAKVGVEVNHLQLAASNNQIALEAEKQYWQIVALKEKLNTLNRYLSMVDTLHKEVNDARQAGLITQNDLLKVELKQNELKMTRLKLVNGIKLAKMALCQYIGVEYQETVDVSGALPAPESPALYYTDHQAALLKRNEYKLLQKSAQAEKLRTKLQLGEYLPQVSVGVGAQYTDIDETDKKNEFVFGMVQIPISGYWEASHKLKDRHIQEQINDNLVKDNTEKLLLQMQQARNTFDEAYEQVLLAETSIRQAKENLKENDDNYKAGLIQVSDLLEAQAQLQQSSDQYTDAVINYQTSKVTYLQVCGE
ncbi:MAG: efflux RND transporter permease subunit, partial [Bacteroidota bacterium]|nr:efflux RND transporter permease subunit [Bacteroidota bacterium]